ncbi:MAG: tetratricopeptide repeat protein [Luteimonas sp.]
MEISADGEMRRGPVGQSALPTTSGVIHAGNLEAQVASARQQVERQPQSPSARLALAGSLYTRAMLRSNLDEIQAAVDVMDEALRLQPEGAAHWLLRAKLNQSLHRFELAKRDLRQGQKLGLPADQVAAVERELDWVEGRYETAIPEIRLAAEKNRNFSSVARLAQLEHDLGNRSRARSLFAEAERRVVDTNPIPVAWLDVQRGIQAVESGDLELGITFFRSAVERLPSYLLAREHLAEALNLSGRKAEAVTLYEAIVAESNDPEFMGALAAIYREQGRVPEADQLKSKATARYEVLLQRYPEAMYWHASEFFLDEGGKPSRSVELLRNNLALRPNASSYVALAKALFEDGQLEAATEAIDHALKTPLVSAQMFWTAARIHARKGSAMLSKRHAEKAVQCSAVVETIEGGIGPDADEEIGSSAVL